MLRMAHHVLSQSPSVLTGCTDDDVMSAVFDEHKKVISNLPRVESLVVDEVAEFYKQHDQDFWDIKVDFPKCIPFSQMVFVEWKEPEFMMLLGERVRNALPGWMRGVMIETFDLQLCKNANEFRETYGISNESDVRWASALQSYTFARGQVTMFGGRVVVWFSSHGVPIEAYTVLPGYSRQSEEFIGYSTGASFADMLHIPLLAFSFSHCKNIARPVDASEELNPSLKWMQRQRAPRVKYRVLNIEPMRHTLRTEGDIERNGIKKALHICRGHFATYTEDKPLFGHTVGTVWKPGHVRGDIKQGAVVKDYSVGVPDSAN